MSEGFVDVEDGRLWFETAGDGPSIAFLHPGLWDSRTWDEQFGLFSESYRVVRYDARGYGRSGRPEPGAPYSHVQDLVAVMDAAGVDRSALVGCSTGAAIAIDAALTHPGRVTALVLAGAGINGDFDLTADEEAELERLNGPVEEALRDDDLEAAEDARLRIWAALGTDDPAGAWIRQIAFDNLHELTMDESGRRDISPSAIERLEDVAAPTLVLPADHDPLAYRRVSAILAERIPRARLVQIPETDHVVNVRRPSEFDRIVLEFLGEVL
ncbi:MAG TPA: alpha/beta hydrolase [Actinomycetota bacterium]|nr:alpha/beta hydrolase [Actinomycetota bacterium]